MGLLDDLDNIILAVHTKQKKYKYNFITEYVYSDKQKCMMRRYRIIKYHTEVIENKRYQIQDAFKRGKLLEIITYLTKELEYFNRKREKAVDSS